MNYKYKHTEQDIISYLERENVGTLATTDKDINCIRLRVMYYGVDEKFNFYLMSTKSSPKIEQILNSPIVSFLVLGLEEPYDNSWEVEVDGKSFILKNKEEIKYALKKLKDRNPFADVSLESNIINQFELIKIVPKIIRFRIYGEALSGEPPTVLEFKIKDGKRE